MTAPAQPFAAASGPPLVWTTVAPGYDPDDPASPMIGELLGLPRGTVPLPEPTSGVEILEEWNDDVGLLLFRTAQEVLLWSKANPARRRRLFADGAQSHRLADLLAAGDRVYEVEDELRLMTSLLTHPESVDGWMLQRLCSRVAEWAKREGRLSTALAFQELNVYSGNLNAKSAYSAALCAVNTCNSIRRNSWAAVAAASALTEEAQVAAKSIAQISYTYWDGDWQLFYQFNRASHSLMSADACCSEEAEVDLATAHSKQGALSHSIDQLIRCEVMRLESYALRALANTAATVWMDVCQFEEALKLLREAARGPGRVAAAARFNMARCFGELGRSDGFEEQWRWALEGLLESPITIDHCGFLEIALGARALGHETAYRHSMDLSRSRATRHESNRAMSRRVFETDTSQSTLSIEGTTKLSRLSDRVLQRLHAT